MAIDDTVRRRLLENNPFSSGSVGDPRESGYPDVASVDREVTRSIIHLIDQKRRQSSAPRAAAVLGETGSGKTHLIGRLIRAGGTGAVPFSVAYIRPFVDPAGAFRYLLREIAGHLTTAPSPGAPSRLSILCARIFTRALCRRAAASRNPRVRAKAVRCRKDPLHALTLTFKKEGFRRTWLKEVNRTLKERHAPHHSRFLQVLMQHLFYPERRGAVRRWLMGSAVDAEDCDLLKVPDRSTDTPEAREAEAQQLLLCLDEMIAVYDDRPLAVIFDQLENLRSEGLVAQFGHLIWFLVDTTRAMMPIVFLRGMDWESRFKTMLDESIVTRIENSLFLLNGCTPEQAQAIVRDRLEMVLSGLERPHPLYPFYPDHAAAFEKRINPTVKWPRQVINRANRLLLSILDADTAPRTDQQILTDAFKARYEEILAHFDQFEPDDGRLALALSLYLDNRPAQGDYNLEGLSEAPESLPYIDLIATRRRRGGGSAPIALMLDTALHHKAIGARLRRAIAFLESQPEGGALYIRDLRCPFPGPPEWPGTNRLLQRFNARGGRTLFLDKKAAAHWYALALLKFDVAAGDVARDDGTPIGEAELAAFIRERLDGARYPAFTVVDSYLSGRRPTEPPEGDPPAEPVPESDPEPDPGPEMTDSTIPRRVVEILKTVPAKMLKADLLASRISEGLPRPLSVADLLLRLTDCRDRFTFIRALDGTVVKLKLEWLHAQP